MMFPSRRAMLAAALCLILANPSVAGVQRYSVVASGENVGTLTVELNDRIAAVDYAVSNNGRGPKLRETIELDEGGIPIRWTIDGSSLFGNSVQERYSWTRGIAEWSSQADQGRVKARTPPLYIGNDVSPWALGMYAQALLKAPGHALKVLPRGELRLEEAAQFSLGEGRDAVQLTAYALSGIDLQPRFVLFDVSGELFGTLDGVIRQGFERYARELEQRADAIGLQRAMQAQAKLAHRFDKPVRIVNVRIFDPQTMQLGQPSSVVVFRDKITMVEPAQAAAGRRDTADEVVIEGQGGTLVPGLHDMHSHTTLLSNLFNLAAGVTATRDMGNDNDLLPGWIERVESGALAGPRIVSNGFLEGRSPHSARLGFVVATLEEALEKVRWYAERGYWQIKIYNSMNPDWVAPIAAEAHRLGMTVTGHVPAFSSPDRVLKDGYDEIAHINQLMLGWVLEPSEDTRTPLRLTAMARAKDLDLASPRVRATIDLMKSKGAALDTTAMTLERLMLSRQGEVPEGDAPYLDHVPVGYQRYRKRSFVPLTKPQADAAYRGGFDKLIETLRTLDANGIQLLPGTDDTTGFSLHRELELYVKAGLPPGKALRRATLDCERYFGREPLLGSIERGKLADFILVDGDPTRDISRIRQVRMTMRGGVMYFPSEIYTYLSVRPFAAPPSVTSMESKE
jgi:imidazolonepropionase-like amidohydrolase